MNGQAPNPLSWEGEVSILCASMLTQTGKACKLSRSRHWNKMVRKLNRHLPGWKVSVNYFYLPCVWNCIGYASGHGQQFLSELWLVLIKFSLRTTAHVTENPYLGLNCLETRIAPYSLPASAWLLKFLVVTSGWNGLIYLLGFILNWRAGRKKKQFEHLLLSI